MAAWKRCATHCAKHAAMRAVTPYTLLEFQKQRYDPSDSDPTRDKTTSTYKLVSLKYRV